MSATFVGSNVVIAAKQFNPSIFSQLWLVEQEIVGKDEFEQGLIISEALVQVTTKRFQLVVVQEQLQFGLAHDAEDQGNLVKKKVGKIVSTLPHTPYTGIGLNFMWHLSDNAKPITSITREMFFQNKNPFNSFDSEDAKFGAYMSKNFLGFRLRLDIRPVKNMENKQFVQFSFNFHNDIMKSNPVDTINETLSKWDEASAEAKRIFLSTVGNS